MTDDSDAPELMDQVTEELLRSLVYSANEQTQAKFRQHHSEMIERSVLGIYAAHKEIERFRQELSGNLRTATLEQFFHSAINSVLCATYHLVSGYPIASGNMMRHHTEAIAMALLCLDKTSGVLEVFSADRRNYPVDKAPTQLRRNKRRKALKKLIDFDEAAWEQILELNKLYSALSHASALSLAHANLLSTETGMILGSEYDLAKSDAYASDLQRCATAAEALAQLVGVVTDRMQELPEQF